MSYKVSDIFDEVLSIIGVQRMNETADIMHYNTVKRTCNFMMDSWSGSTMMVRAALLENFPVTAGVSSYTIGSGATFNTAKPVEIVNAYIRDSYGVDYDLEIINKDRLDALPDKSYVSSRPIALNYDPGQSQQSSQKGTITLYYTPDADYTVYLESFKYLTEFVNLTDIVTFEPAYFKCIVWNCAQDVWMKFWPNKPLPTLIQHTARASKQIVMAMNHEIPTSVCDVPGTGDPSGDNIISGDWIS